MCVWAWPSQGNDEAPQGVQPLRWARLLYVGALAQAAVTLAATLCSDQSALAPGAFTL